jgi:hypothetical protein
MADCILKNRPVKDAATALRRRFLEMRFCFSGKDVDELLQQLHGMVG